MRTTATKLHVQESQGFSLRPQHADDDYETLDLNKIHPETRKREQLMFDSPNRWDILHNFVITWNFNHEFRTKLRSRRESF